MTYVEEKDWPKGATFSNKLMTFDEAMLSGGADGGVFKITMPKLCRPLVAAGCMISKLVFSQSAQ
jgi:hypothetical protein